MTFQLATWQSSSTAIGTQDLLYGNASRTPALAISATSATDINGDALGSTFQCGGWGCFGKVLGSFGAGFASGVVNGLDPHTS